MSIVRGIDLTDGTQAVVVNHNPTVTPTDLVAGSMILEKSSGIWYRKNDTGSTTNVTPEAIPGIDWANGVPPTTAATARFVRVASTGNVASKSGLLTIDGITLVAGDRVLLKNQSTGSENAIWVASAGAWVLASDWVTGAVSTGFMFRVSEGTANGRKGFKVKTQGPIVVGSTSLDIIAEAASDLATTTEPVNIGAAVAPITGQKLTATSPTAATWQSQVFTRGGTVLSPTASTNVTIWRAPFTCTITTVYFNGKSTGSTGTVAGVNIKVAGVNVVSSPATQTADGTWKTVSSGLTFAVVAGDKVEILWTTLTGTHQELAIQFDATRP